MRTLNALAHDWRVTLAIVAFGFSVAVWRTPTHPYTAVALAFLSGFNLRVMMTELSDWLDDWAGRP